MHWRPVSCALTPVGADDDGVQRCVCRFVSFAPYFKVYSECEFATPVFTLPSSAVNDRSRDAQRLGMCSVDLFQMSTTTRVQSS